MLSFGYFPVGALPGDHTPVVLPDTLASLRSTQMECSEMQGISLEDVECAGMQGISLEPEASDLMTTEQLDAMIGRLMRERKETEIRKIALEAEGARIGGNLAVLGQGLQRKLSGIQLQGEHLESDFLHSAVWIKPCELEETSKIVKLANDYREAIKALKQISQQLVQAGWQ
jgi:NAD(P)H-nitrite reductase large subunit